MGKTKNKKMIGGILIIVVAIVLAIVVANLTKGSTTGDVTIKGSGAGAVTGLKCTDETLNHPVFVDVQPLSHTNTITANFTDDTLSLITYRYNGAYRSDDEAETAKNRAAADYNLILANNYGVEIDIFTHTFMRDGRTVALTISGNADKVTSRTAPYFLLDSTSSFPKTLDEMRAAYEAKGLSCTVEGRD